MVFTLLLKAPKFGGMTFVTPIGDISAPSEVLSPLLKKLAKKPTSFNELMTILFSLSNLHYYLNLYKC